MGLHKKIKTAIFVVMFIGLCGAIYEQLWLNSLIIVGIMILSYLSLRYTHKLGVFIPPDIELFAILFIFASLFLGEVRGYYIRFWWWDVLLHASSGFLLGILAFLLIHVLNENERIKLDLSPIFVALFSFSFAVAMGAMWEIFEFSVDRLFGMNMQKTGLVDTMWDLIINTLGAIIVSILGYVYLKHGKRSFVIDWVDSFVLKNPRGKKERAKP